jgi:hypothetical protein
MALANALCLIFSTMSVAHANIDIFEMRALIYPSVAFNKKRGLQAPPLETAPAFHYKYAEGAAMVHICVHAITIGSLLWSLSSVPETRRIMWPALAFEIASLAVSPLMLSVMEEILVAKTGAGIKAALEKLMRRQLLRNLLLHVPCMLLCLSAVMRLIARP